MSPNVSANYLRSTEDRRKGIASWKLRRKVSNHLGTPSDIWPAILPLIISSPIIIRETQGPFTATPCRTDDMSLASRVSTWWDTNSSTYLHSTGLLVFTTNVYAHIYYYFKCIVKYSIRGWTSWIINYPYALFQRSRYSWCKFVQRKFFITYFWLLFQWFLCTVYWLKLYQPTFLIYQPLPFSSRKQFEGLHAEDTIVAFYARTLFPFWLKIIEWNPRNTHTPFLLSNPQNATVTTSYHLLLHFFDIYWNILHNHSLGSRLDKPFLRSG